MLFIGAIGLVFTVFWILLDLVNRKKHEEKVVQKAIQNFKSSELNTNYSVQNNLSNISNKIEKEKEVIVDDDSDYSEITEVMNGDEREGNEKTEIMTEAILNKSTKFNKENIGKSFKEESTDLINNAISIELLNDNTEVMEINDQHRS